jgi:hypothetical protein
MIEFLETLPQSLSRRRLVCLQRSAVGSHNDSQQSDLAEALAKQQTDVGNHDFDSLAGRYR